MLLVHNHDTSIKTFAKMLNDNIKKIPNITGFEELALCDRDIVSITNKSLSEDIEELIKKLNNPTNNPLDIFPQIIIAQSHEIQPSVFGRSAKKFQMYDIIKLQNEVDPADTVTLTGQMFTYESPVQIVILARAGYSLKELSLHTLNILANNEKINYSLIIEDKDNAQFHSVSDYGHINLVGIKSASFSDASVKNSGIVATAINFTIREQFFMLRDTEDVTTQYRTTVTVEHHERT